MSEYVFRLPDLGEGTVSAEIIEWHVAVGDDVTEGQTVCDVTTDKANVEVPSPVAGRVLRISGSPGESVAVGSELIALETAEKPVRGASARDARPARREDRSAVQVEPVRPLDTGVESRRTSAPRLPRRPPDSGVPAPEVQSSGPSRDGEPGNERAAGPVRDSPAPRGRAMASPSVRRRAREADIDLADVPGSGPHGRIVRRDLDAYLADGGVEPGEAAAAPEAHTPEAHSPAAHTPAALDPSLEDATGYEAVPIIGVRRVIAERMSAAKREIPHFSYVEEIDVTALEALRAHLNEQRGRGGAGDDGPRHLGMLPFIAFAMIRSLADFPMCNAHHDAAENVVKRYRHVHLGIAAQTSDGLKVPVVRHAEKLVLDELAGAIAEVAEAARGGTAPRAILGGSTITLTSLGKLGGIVSTPIVNLPEVAIVGVNRAVTRPVVVAGNVVVRTMMNLSSSFDHRFVDGHDAASYIQAIKRYLEQPATLFM